MTEHETLLAQSAAVAAISRRIVLECNLLHPSTLKCLESTAAIIDRTRAIIFETDRTLVRFGAISPLAVAAKAA